MSRARPAARTAVFLFLLPLAGPIACEQPPQDARPRDASATDAADKEAAEACPTGFVAGYAVPGCGDGARKSCVPTAGDAGLDTYCTCSGRTISDRVQGALEPFRHIGACSSASDAGGSN